jgi:hypothetical protein
VLHRLFGLYLTIFLSLGARSTVFLHVHTN